MLAALLALLAVPAEAMLAVSALTLRRPAAFLVRGSVERAAVFGVSAAAAAVTAVELWLWPELSPAACAPALASAPWLAGEILSGPSVFRVEGLLGAAAAAHVGTAFAQSPLLGALAAAAVYLAVRGPVIDDSTIYES
ncbi:MAG TPA: hypothetical protein VLW85_11515 [Myxococcales bacterium]|nr:hypothetical protein [Myxococcales bacterium]